MQIFFGIYVRLMFEFVSIPMFVFYWFAQWFVSADERPRMWRRAVKTNNSLLLRIAGIRLVLHDIPARLKQPSIIVSNHPTFMDGFIHFSLFGPDVIPMTGPAHYFTFPFDQVFIRMGAIHVARDADEEQRFPESYSRKTSVTRMIECLRAGLHVLIFPEGHIERTKRLYYVHTGAARAAIQSHSPVAVFGIIGAEHVMGSGVRLRPGTLHIHFGGYVQPMHVSHKLPFRSAVKAMRREIELAFIRVLPRRYLPSYIKHDVSKTIAAFFDIDNTLYSGVFAKDVVMQAMKERLIPRRRACYVLWLLALDTLRIIPHEALMARAHRVVAHYTPAFIAQYARSYFLTHGVHKLFEPALSLLKNHAERGHHIVLVTESLDVFAHIFAHHLKAEAGFGTTLRLVHHKYTGDIDRLLYGPEKAHVVHTYAHEHSIDLSQSYAYGDSYSTDAPMMRAVGHAIAIRPTHRLARYARRHGWPIIVN